MHKDLQKVEIFTDSSLSDVLSNLKELPVKFFVNGTLSTEIICTPSKLDDLAIGWLISEGYIKDFQDIISIKISLEKALVDINIKTEHHLEKPRFSDAVISAIIKYETSDFIPACSLPSNFLETVKIIGTKVNGMRTKGLHGAMIYTQNNEIFREDISRHSAVDKAIGGSLKLGIDVASSILLTTGRISSELLWKSKMLGIPTVASIKYPSETGIKIATSWGISIASKILSPEADLYICQSCKENSENLY